MLCNDVRAAGTRAQVNNYCINLNLSNSQEQLSLFGSSQLLTQHDYDCSAFKDRGASQL